MSVITKAVAATLLFTASLYAHGKIDKPVRELHVLSVSPGSTDALWNDAELIVHVRVLGGHAKATANADFVHTEHRARVIEVFKNEVSPDCATQAADVAACAPVVGQDLTFLEIAGEVETETAILRIVGATPLKTGAEYVLYLRWHAPLKAYIATYGASGAFEIRNGVVHPSAEWVESEHSGKPLPKLAEELRRKKSKQ